MNPNQDEDREPFERQPTQLTGETCGRCGAAKDDSCFWGQCQECIDRDERAEAQRVMP
jgi:hypothetical protein